MPHAGQIAGRTHRTPTSFRGQGQFPRGRLEASTINLFLNIFSRSLVIFPVTPVKGKGHGEGQEDLVTVSRGSSDVYMSAMGVTLNNMGT